MYFVSSTCLRSYLEYIAFTFYQELGKVRKAGEKNLLSSYHDSWKQFSRGIDYLHKLYLYLNTQRIWTEDRSWPSVADTRSLSSSSPQQRRGMETRGDTKHGARGGGNDDRRPLRRPLSSTSVMSRDFTRGNETWQVENRQFSRSSTSGRTHET